MGKQGRSSGGDSDKHEQKLQAVLLAIDNDTDRSFAPLSGETAKVLCSLNNVTLLDYAIEFLAGAGVEELVVVATRSEVRTHVQHHTWNGSILDMECIVDSSFASEGDALRELDKRNLIKSDPFLLLHGDVVTNVDIGPAMEAHKKRKKKDSSAIMTLLMKQVGGWNVVEGQQQQPAVDYSQLRTFSDDLMVGLDPTQENRVLVYDNHNSKKTVSIPCSFFGSHPSVELRCDLLDCGIDICSPDVLARFSDAFDYEHIRQEFVAYSVAEEEEGLQNKIYAHLLQSSEYAARVCDFKSYAAISKDLLRRWCYPIVPDNLPSGYEQQYRYTLQHHYLYREMKRGRTKIGRSSVVRGPGMVGSQCVIQNDCNIQGTVIGNHCNISSRVTLRDCHLWENVVIEEGATVVQSLLANNCVIKAGATVGRGCVVGSGCVVGANVVLPEFTRITMSLDQDDSDDDFGFVSESESDGDSSGSNQEAVGEEGVVSDHNVVGPDGLGRIWSPSNEDDSDSDEEDNGSGGPSEMIKAQSMGYDPSILYRKRFETQQEDDEDGFSDVEEPPDMHYGDDSGESGFSFGAPDPSNLNEFGVIIGRQQGVDVVKELKLMCLEHENTSPIENLGIELNSYKFSQNATYSDCNMAATLAILEKMDISSGMGASKLVAVLRAQLEHWAPLLLKMSISIDEEKSIISAIETVALGGGEVGDVLSTAPSFRLLLQTLHDDEIVDEAAILSWAAERREQDEATPLGKLFQQQPTQDFLDYLEEESEDDDESEEETSD